MLDKLRNPNYWQPAKIFNSTIYNNWFIPKYIEYFETPTGVSRPLLKYAENYVFLLNPRGIGYSIPSNVTCFDECEKWQFRYECFDLNDLSIKEFLGI